MIYENTAKLSKVLMVSESSLHDSLWDSQVTGTTNSNTVIFFTRAEVVAHLRLMLKDFSRDMLWSFDSGDMETFNITATAIGELSGFALLIHESTADTFYIDME